LRNNVANEDKPFDVDVVIINPLDKPLTNVSVKLKLFDGCIVKNTLRGLKMRFYFY
jgi:hypothetical protein